MLPRAQQPLPCQIQASGGRHWSSIHCLDTGERIPPKLPEAARKSANPDELSNGDEEGGSVADVEVPINNDPVGRTDGWDGKPCIHRLEADAGRLKLRVPPAVERAGEAWRAAGDCGSGMPKAGEWPSVKDVVREFGEKLVR